jgi:hypothetical protein
VIYRGLVFFFILASATLSLASPLNSLERLTQDDQLIYQSTFAKCRPGTITSAIRIGFDKENFIGGLNNWLQIISINMDASESRSNARGLSPQISQLRISEGFWLAMTECYGYKYGELNYGNLMKQIIDAGHLATETASTSVGLVALLGGAKVVSELSTIYPIATRFVASSLIAIHVAVAIQQIRLLTSNELTREEQEQFAEAQSRIFAEPNQAIQEGIEKSQTVIERINEKLLDPTLSAEKRSRLVANKENLLAILRKLPQYNNLQESKN